MNKQMEAYPIIEAVCEFRFDPASTWDMAVPGLLYEKLKEQFPIRKTRHQLINKIQPTPQGMQHEVNQSAMLQMLSNDEKSLVQVNEQLLSINVLPPYPKWEAFHLSIDQALESYIEVAKPKSIQRVGMRYINRIWLPEAGVKMNEYFNVGPYIGEGLPQNYSNFSLNVLLPYDNNSFLNIQSRNEPNTERGIPIILDLDFFSEIVTFDGVPSWIDIAHKELDIAFKNCVTNEARALWKGK
jgi:uncharacterized protein (TIGR04255 family)